MCSFLHTAEEVRERLITVNPQSKTGEIVEERKKLQDRCRTLSAEIGMLQKEL